MNIHFIKGQYIWQKKFFDVIRISFRWHKTGKAPVFKHHKFSKKTLPPPNGSAKRTKVLKKYGAKRGFLKIKAKSHFCQNYLQQLGLRRRRSQESFLIFKLSSLRLESNFYKKIVEFHHLKKREIGQRSVRVSDVQGSPNFLFRIHNILNFYTLGPKAYEYLIKYQWTQNIRLHSPKGRPKVLPKFRNPARVFCLPHRTLGGQRPQPFQKSLIWGSLPNMSFIIWKICLDPSRAKPPFHKRSVAKPPTQSHAFEGEAPIAKKAAIFPDSSLEDGHHHHFLSVFDKKTKGPTKYDLPKSDPIYQNIWFQDYEKSNQNTYFLQRPISFPFQWIQKGDLLSDCSSSLKGELALGKNLFVAYMPWEGFNFEDAVLINEKVLSKYTSLHIEKYDLEIAESGLEKITTKVPGISTKNLQKLDPNGVVKIGSWVTEGDILVGRILPIPTETQNLLTHEKLLYDIVVFGQKETQIQERCLRVPQGVSGRIIRISYTHRIKHQENRTSHPKKIRPWDQEIFKNPSGELVGRPRTQSTVQPKAGPSRQKPGRVRAAKGPNGASLGPLRGPRPAQAIKKELSVHLGPAEGWTQKGKAQRLFVWGPRSGPKGEAPVKIPFFFQHLYCHLVGSSRRRPSYDLGYPSDSEQKKRGFRQKTLPIAVKVPQMMKTVILQQKVPVFLRWFRRYESFFKTYFWVIRTKIFGKRGWLPSFGPEGRSRPKDPFIQYNNKRGFSHRFIKTLVGRRPQNQKGFFKRMAKPQFLLRAKPQLGFRHKNWVRVAPGQWRNFMNIHKRNFRRVRVLSPPLCGSGTRPFLISPRGFPTSFKKNQNQFRKKSQTKFFKTKKRNLKNIWRSYDSLTGAFKPLEDRWPLATSTWGSGRPNQDKQGQLSYKNFALWRRGLLAESVPTVCAARPRPRGDLAAANTQFINSLKKITLYIAEKREFQIGDKISGRHGNKGIISQIFSNSDMPYLANGCTLDVLLNPLGVPSRMNVGQIFECLLGFTGKIFHTKFQVLCFDEIYGYESSRSFIYSKLLELCKKTRQKWLLSKKTPGKFHLFDGRNGQLFDQSIMVGSTYLMKLIHVVDEKIHARGTGPYSLITQQPLRGRAKHGGQRLGEMEVWALQGFGSAYTLQELLTVKSDDLHGRNQVMQTLLKNTPLRFGTPESLRVVLRELQCLCLDLQLLEASHKK